MTRRHIPVPGGRRNPGNLANLARGREIQHAAYAARLETYTELADQGEHPDQIATRMGVCQRTIERYRRTRHDHPQG
jgi:hypothetical protein